MNISEELLNNIIPNFSNIKTNVVSTEIIEGGINIISKPRIRIPNVDLTLDLSEEDRHLALASGTDTLSKWFHQKNGSVYSVRPNIIEATDYILVDDHTLDNAFMMTPSIYFNFEQSNHSSVLLQKINKSEALHFIDNFEFDVSCHIDMQVLRQSINSRDSDKFFLCCVFVEGRIKIRCVSAYDTLSNGFGSCNDYFSIIETCFKILAFTEIPYLKPTKLSNKQFKKVHSKISKSYLKSKDQSFRICALPLVRELRKDYENQIIKNKLNGKTYHLKNGRIGHKRYLNNSCFVNKQGQNTLVKPVLDENGNLPKRVFRVQSPPKGSKPLNEINLDNG